MMDWWRRTMNYTYLVMNYYNYIINIIWLQGCDCICCDPHTQVVVKFPAKVSLSTWCCRVTDGVYCASVWDGWGCWDYTPAGTRAYISCPSYKSGFDSRRQYFMHNLYMYTRWVFSHRVASVATKEWNTPMHCRHQQRWLGMIDGAGAPWTYNCLICLGTSEPHRLCHSIPCGCIP